MVARIYSSESERRRAEYQRAKARRDALNATDPILLLTPEERAYIAGLLDGEGSLSIGRVGPRRLTYYPIIAVAMTHFGTIEWLRDKLSLGTIKLNNHTRVREGWKPEHLVRLHGRRATLLCQSLLPYFVTKREHATIIAGFPCDQRLGPNIPLSAAVMTERERLYWAMKPHNRRGRE